MHVLSCYLVCRQNYISYTFMKIDWNLSSTIILNAEYPHRLVLKFNVQVYNTGGPVLDLRPLLHTERFCYIMQIIIIISKFTLQPNHTLGMFTVLLHGTQDFTTALSYMDSQCWMLCTLYIYTIQSWWLLIIYIVPWIHMKPFWCRSYEV